MKKLANSRIFCNFAVQNRDKNVELKHIRNMELLLLLLLLGMFGGSKKKDKKKRRCKKKDDDSWLDYAWFHDHDQQI